MKPSLYLGLCTQFFDLDKPVPTFEEYAFFHHYIAQAQGHILEPMCGTGRYLIPYTQEGFNIEGFARFHPGGALGKKLYLRVADLYVDNEKPEVNTEASIKQVIMEMTRKRLGVTAVTGNDGRLVGIITDGDLRRMLEKTDDIQRITARDIMSENPKKIIPSEMAVNALDIMRTNSITQLVVAENETYLGILHLHNLVNEGLL